MYQIKYISTKIYRTYIVVLILLLAVSTNQTFATDYYFSSLSGNDNRTSGEAQNPSTPWKSIDKLNSFASNLKGSDRILFKSGETFYGTINTIKSGTVGTPIIYTSYSSGAKPIITSLVTVNNWVAAGNGVYQADLSAYNLSKVQIVLLNNKIQEIGRYPNSDAPNGGYLTIGSGGANYITTQETSPYSGSGGEVVIRKNNWIIDRHQINSISGNYISYMSNASVYPAQAGYGYFLQNHSSLLDKSGEWAYDPTNKKLTINLTGHSLSSVEVAVATKDHLITNQMYSTNMTFSNLHFKGSNTNLINISKSENVKIDNCLLEFSGQNAINSNETRGITIQNSEIHNSLNNGIYISFGSPNATIRNNIITNTMKFQGMGKNSDLNGIGIYLCSDADNSIIEKNTLENVGFNGIHFGGDYTKVLNNFVNEFCLIKQDGGGIYTNSDGLRNRNNTGREVIGNIITNGHGNKMGSQEDVEMAEGIYLDDNSSGVKVADNTIAFVSGKGLYLHNANNIEIINNLFYKVKSQVHFLHDYMGDPIRNIKISNNKFSSIDNSEYAYSVYSVLNDVGSVGTINSNYFLDPFDNEFFIYTKTESDGALGVDRNLEDWKATFGYGANSSKPELNISKYEIKSSNLIKSSDFNDASIIAGAYNASTKIDANGITGNSYLINPNNSNKATVYVHLGATKNEDNFLVEFDMKSSTSDMPIELFLEGTYNLDKGEGNKIVATKTSAKTYQILLTSITSKSNESLVFRIPNTAKNVYLDNLKISKVTIDPVDISKIIYFGYNYSNSSVQKSLDGTYKSATNETFSGSVTIAPFSSVLLAKISDEKPESINQSPTVSLAQPSNNQVLIQGSEDVQLVANAIDPEGEIKRVELYANGTLLTTLTDAPYSYSLSSAKLGSHEVHAKVVDNGDLSAISETITFVVEAAPITPINQAPTVSLTKPSNNQVLIQGVDPIELVANATDPEGEIKRVEFYGNGTLLATLTKSPYSYTLSSLPIGNHKVLAKVFDMGELSATSETINFSVEAAKPAINFTGEMVSPANNSSYVLGETTVVLKTNATNSDIKIKEIEFFNWGYPLVKVTTAPFDFEWTKIEVGSYKVSAKITDTDGKAYTTEVTRFSVTKGAAPIAPLTIYISQPTDNQEFVHGKDMVNLKSLVSDFSKVKNITYYNWGQLLTSTTELPHEFNWSAIEVGAYSIYAVVTDTQGKTTTSKTVNFKVTAPLKEVTASAEPTTLKMVQPYDNQVFRLGENGVILKAKSDGEVSTVRFFNWYTPLVVANNKELEFNWSKIEVGSYLVYAEITDSKGKVIKSEPISFKVNSPGARIGTFEDLLSASDTTKLGIADKLEVKTEETYPSSFGIKMGPNPTSSYLRIFFEDYPADIETQISIVDMRGIEMLRKDANTNDGTVEMDVNSLRQGVYIVKLNLENKSIQTKKLIIN